MAVEDTLTSSNNLKVTWQFVDGDTRTQTIKNPIDSLDDTGVQHFRDVVSGYNALVSDTTGADLSVTRPMAAAYIEERTRLKLDLRPQN